MKVSAPIIAGAMVFCAGFLQSPSPLSAEEQNPSPFQGASNVTIGGEWFLSYENGHALGGGVNRFLVNRGYIIIDKQLNNWLSARITPDVSLDHEGDGRGSIEMRIKYLNLKAHLHDFGCIAKPYAEFGVVHRPWIGFEEHINAYRVQGTMFLERQNILNSADFGVSFTGLFGGEMDGDYQKKVSKSMPGRYGSFTVGVFNGGGYHAIEENNNKTVEGRLSIRPLPDVLPGLQFSYTGAYGKGNVAREPDWTLNAGFVSYETAGLVATAQYFAGTGNSSGAFVDAKNRALGHDGYSFFAEYKLPAQRLSFLARYDKWNGAKIEYDSERVIAGVACTFASTCKLVLNYDSIINSAEKNDPLSSLVKLDMLVKF